MNSEDWPNRFERAFDEVKPVDEAHAERVAKMRESFMERGRETAFEMELDKYALSVRKVEFEAVRQSVAAAQALTKELAEERRAEFARQVEALERIVQVLKSRRS